MKKLSVSMETMIREAAFHEVRQDGQILKSGPVVAGKTNTVVALIDRGLATPADAENFGLNWLTGDGEEIRQGMMDVIINELDAAAGPDLGDDVARAIASFDEQSFMEIETFELPGDAERIWDAENAAAERASIEDEQDRDADEDRDAGITRLIQSLDAYVLTSKHVFVSKDRYLAPMATVRAYKLARLYAWHEVQEVILDLVNEHNAFMIIDSQVADGVLTFGKGDRQKRIMRQIIRPTLGPKRKPSKRR